MKFRKLSALLVIYASACCFGKNAFAQDELFTVLGDDTWDMLGYSVSGGGDIDNDGYDDFIVGAVSDGTIGNWSGMIRVYSGQTGTVLYSRYGDAANTELGGSVSSGGDVNNDGYTDFIAGAAFSDGNGLDSGLIRVYSGQTGAVLYDRYGDSMLDQLGYSVSAAGDVNNDGFADFVAGAPGHGAEAGQIRVYSGQNGAVLHDRIGNTDWDLLGWSVSGAGDVNNDGFADLIAGAMWTGPSGQIDGRFWVYSGRDGAVLYDRRGDSSGDLLGQSVGGAGDVDNDGHDDFMAGAIGNDSNGSNAGMIRIYSGQTGAILYSLYGDAVNANLGTSVSSVGDVDQDGYDDFVAGAHGSGADGTGAGMVRLYSGQTGGVLYSRQGDAAVDRLGYSVSGAGDVNADGIPDVIAGAPRNDANGLNSGMARVYTGPCALVQSYGVGCLGSGDTHIPELVIETNCWGTGGTINFKIRNAWGGGHAWLLASTQRASVFWNSDCYLLVQAPYSVFYLGTLDNAGPPPNGNGSMDLPIGISNPLVPSSLALQVGIVQPNLSGFKNLTNGVEITVP